MSKSKTTYPFLVAAAAAAIGYLVYRRVGNTKPSSKPSNNMPTSNNSSYPNSNYTTRGYRNNNPLNIRKNDTVWVGEIRPSSDSAFAQFVSMEYGYRAAFRLLRTYSKDYGCNTIRKIINRWAPSNENNTSGYVTAVSTATGISPDTVVSYTNAAQMQAIVNAMSRVENGYGVPVPVADLISGWNLYIQSI